MSKIMVVDDSPDIVWVYSMMLKKAGYSVVSASSGEEALEMVPRERPELILLDVMMPGIDGWDVAKKLKENPETEDILIIMVSVRSEAEDKRKSFEYAHADGHVNKLRSADILGTVGGLLKEKSQNLRSPSPF